MHRFMIPLPGATGDVADRLLADMARTKKQAFSGEPRVTFVLRAGMVALLVLTIWLAFRDGTMRQGRMNEPRKAREPGVVDVVLVVVDTERWDFTSIGGYPEHTTPFLEHLASRGVTFSHAFAPGPWTVPSMYSMMTGLWPAQHAMVQGQAAATGVTEQKVLPGEARTLAEMLADGGYETYGICTNFHLSRRFGFSQGFDTTVGEDFAFMPFPNMALRSISRRLNRSSRYFLWLHYLDPHHPYMQREPWFSRYNESSLTTYEDLGLQATMAYYRQVQGIGPDTPLTPEDVIRYYKLAERWSFKPMLLFARLRAMGIDPRLDWKRFLAASYASEIRMTDDAVKTALQEILGVDDGTVIIVTSDHGEELWERGNWGHRGTDSLHQELLHVPLVVILPGQAHAGRVVDEPVSLVDLMPTILELAGLPVPEDLPGRSLVDLMAGDSMEPRPLFAEVDSAMGVSRCIIEYPYKYVHSVTTGDGALYHLAHDPHEQTDLSGQQPQRASAMKDRLIQWLEQTPPRWELKEPPPLSLQQIHKLRLLGYVE